MTLVYPAFFNPLAILSAAPATPLPLSTLMRRDVSVPDGAIVADGVLVKDAELVAGVGASDPVKRHCCDPYQ